VTTVVPTGKEARIIRKGVKGKKEWKMISSQRELSPTAKFSQSESIQRVRETDFPPFGAGQNSRANSEFFFSEQWQRNHRKNCSEEVGETYDRRLLFVTQ